MRFIDTNVLLYAVSRDAGERVKAERARLILDSRDLALSVQVLQEFYVQATRSSKADRIEHDLAVRLIESWMRFPVQDTTVPVMQAALASRQRYQLCYWDAAILESARALGCREVLSEDFSAGRDFAGVRIVNPFL